LSDNIRAHESSANATYLGNEGVMIENGESKILFDPFFHNDYNIYQLVSEETRQALFSGLAPYDNIDAIFVSHAHGDHFSAQDVLEFLQKNPKTQLFASNQATNQILALENGEQVKQQLTGIALEYGDHAQTLKWNDLLIEVVRIPHSGWPTSRLDVSNLLFRVTLADDVTVMHMGDADPNDVHFKPYDDLWLKNKTNTAFPPYWFFESTYGPMILDERINAEKSIGIHVPMNVPSSLKNTGKPYFSTPGEQEKINHKHH
jgi:L-ascorbate metabolism protein UlaG (beta-lactamase superfamily)